MYHYFDMKPLIRHVKRIDLRVFKKKKSENNDLHIFICLNNKKICNSFITHSYCLYNVITFLLIMFRLMTGSFDKTVKIWSIDGKFTHKLDNFLATISGICYVPRNKTVWVAGGTSYASLFDPKSGDNVCIFVKDVTNVYLCKVSLFV